MKSIRALFAGLPLVFAAHSMPALACKPVAGVAYPTPTQEERYAQADVVFIARVASVTSAPGVPPRGHAYVLALDVERWTKGSGAPRMEVFDTAGTDCDSLFGIQHIAAETNARSSHWRVYAARREGRLWVVTAERLDDAIRGPGPDIR